MSDSADRALQAGWRATGATLRAWRECPLAVLRAWVRGSAAAAALLLGLVVAVGALAPARGRYEVTAPPFAVGGPGDIAYILRHNVLVLALHALACVAGFIAGSSLPQQATGLRGLRRAVHEHGARLAMAFVAAATAFSLLTQALTIGLIDARVSAALHTDPALLVVALLPHALPELCALFLPLAAWLQAARRGAWETLLAASLISTAVALPVLLATACWEVYVAPHIVAAVVL